MLNDIDPAEVFRDLINWLDNIEPRWRQLESGTKIELLTQAQAYFTSVSHRHGIPEGDFLPPLKKAVNRIRNEHEF